MICKQIGLSLALVGPVMAMDGNELQNFCKADKAFVAAYTIGLIDKAREDSAAAGFDKFVSALNFPDTFENAGALAKGLNQVQDDVEGFCIPQSVNAAQGADVVCKYLATNPKQRSKSGASLVRRALISAWSCK